MRAAAAVGALRWVLAGVYFVRYFIEHHLISPALRVVIEILVGVSCLASAELRVRGRHRYGAGGDLRHGGTASTPAKRASTMAFQARALSLFLHLNAAFGAAPSHCARCSRL